MEVDPIRSSVVLSIEGCSFAFERHLCFTTPPEPEQPKKKRKKLTKPSTIQHPCPSELQSTASQPIPVSGHTAPLPDHSSPVAQQSATPTSASQPGSTKDQTPKPYYSICCEQGSVSCGGFYKVTHLGDSVFVVSEIYEQCDKYFCKAMLCSRTGALYSMVDSLSINVLCNFLSPVNIPAKNISTSLQSHIQRIRSAVLLKSSQRLQVDPCYAREFRKFGLGVKFREEVGKSFSTKGYWSKISLGLADFCHDPAIFGFDLGSKCTRMDFDLLTTGFSKVDTLFGGHWDVKRQSECLDSHF